MATTAEPKLLDRLRDKLRLKHYAWKTEGSYRNWVERFLRFHRRRDGSWRRPEEIGAQGVEDFLTHLAVEGNVAASTQNQALSAILFLYREVLNVELANSTPCGPADRSGYRPFCRPPKRAACLTPSTAKSKTFGSRCPCYTEQACA